VADEKLAASNRHSLQSIAHFWELLFIDAQRGVISYEDRPYITPLAVGLLHLSVASRHSTKAGKVLF